VLIVHGKGAQKGGGVLKAYVNRWLQDIPQVQAFHSAKKQHGSTGSVYVLLRKGEAQKNENRLRYNKGRES
jgi:DNA-nicking Smr family endonuclease